MENNKTLLITGPVIAESKSLNKIIKSALKINMEIIISTWLSSKLEVKKLKSKYPEINYYLCQDINSSLGYKTYKAKKEINFDRQWLLINAVMKLCKKEYIIRIRSDIYLNLESINYFKKELNSGLVLTIDISSVNPVLILSSKLILHPCDWVFIATNVIFKRIIDEAEYYFKMLQHKNYIVNEPYKIEDRTYLSIAASEQLWGASILRIKENRNFFKENIINFKNVSSVAEGIYLVEAKTLQISSDKQRLFFLYPFRMQESDNYGYKKIRISLKFVVEIIIHYIRILTKNN